jgi:hypothetical protein
MDDQTIQMLRSSLTHVFVDKSDRPLSDRLAELGWAEVLDDDAATATRVLFETKGDTVGAGDALGPCLARALALTLDAPELAGATVVLPPSLHPRRLAAPPVLPTDPGSSGRPGQGDVAVTGVVLSTPGAAGAPVASVVAPFEGEEGGVRLAVLSPDVIWKYEPIGGTDADAGLMRASALASAGSVTWIEPGPSEAAWDRAVATGRWALAAELVGISRHVIAQAVSYTGERKQYGRAIGTFQALQHRLASAHAVVVGASHVVGEAASTGSAWTALVAKALAGRAAELSCTQAQQSYGAIGFTWEHEFHRYLRRVYALDWLLGDWRTLEREIGTRLQATGDVPRIGEL